MIASQYIPPHSIEAEQSLLGGLLVDGSKVSDVAEILDAKRSFYNGAHAAIYEQMLALSVSRKPVDILTVAEALKSQGLDETTGGLEYLNAMIASVPNAAHVDQYAKIVQDYALRRQIIAAGNQIAALPFDKREKNSAALLDEADATLTALRSGVGQDGQAYRLASEIVDEVFTELDEQSERAARGELAGVSTGFLDIDHQLCGLEKGNVVVIAGRPSMGKTSLAINIAEHVAIQRKLPVLVFSMEMSGESLVKRILSSQANVNQQTIRAGALDPREWERVTDGLSRIGEIALAIDDRGGLSILQVNAAARKFSRVKGQLGLIIIDYLQLMVADTHGENRATEISNISRSLKSLAKELDVPVIALSQLNRSVEQRTDKRPILSDLRESGAIEQDADVILFIYRDEVYREDSPDKGTAEIIIAKQRNGPTGTVRLAWRGEYSRFDNLSNRT